MQFNSILLFALLVLCTSVYCRESMEARTVSISSGSNSVSFDSTAKLTGKNGYKTKISCDVAADKLAKPNAQKVPLRFRLKYFSSDKDSKSALNMHVGFIEVVEFEEKSTTGFNGYTPGVDTIISNASLNGWVFSPVSNVVNGNGKTYWFTVSDKSNILKLSVFISETPFVVNGSTFSPDQVKINIDIQNYNYVKAGTYLALHVRVQSMSKLDHSKTEHVAAIVGNDISMAFAWAPTVLVNGVTSSVFFSDFSDFVPDTDDDEYQNGELAKQAFYSFPVVQPTTISWDPTLSAWSSSSTLVISSIILCLSLFLSLF